MELLDLIEGRRFMGREFVVWLWFESEMQETNLRPTGVDPVSLWLEAQITLVPAQHWSRRGLADDRQSLWGGYVLSLGGVRV